MLGKVSPWKAARSQSPEREVYIRPGAPHVSLKAAATKFAVRVISEGLRKESEKIRCTRVNSGVVESELADTLSDETARERMKAYRRMAIQPDSIGRAIQYAIEQPNDADADVNAIVVRPPATLI
jgi:NADP-dependent 3-hydroxy acid dehydrogenase YdfG